MQFTLAETSIWQKISSRIAGHVYSVFSLRLNISRDSEILREFAQSNVREVHFEE